MPKPKVNKTPTDRPSLEQIVEAVAGDAANGVADSPLDLRDGLVWARDVYWAYSQLGERMTKAKAGTAARYALWKHANTNMDAFMGTMLPRAMQILDRAQSKGGDDSMVAEAETKSIKELQRILKAAVHEATLAGGSA